MNTLENVKAPSPDRQWSFCKVLRKTLETSDVYIAWYLQAERTILIWGLASSLL
jgi:hypothetical protein